MRSLSLWVLAASTWLFQPQAAAQTPRVEVRYQTRFGDSAVRTPDTVMVAPRALTIRGRFDQPATNHALAGAVQQLGSAIILDLTGYPRSEGIQHMVEPIEFEARITGLSTCRCVLYVRYNLAGGLGLTGRVVKTLPVDIPQ